MVYTRYGRWLKTPVNASLIALEKEFPVQIFDSGSGKELVSLAEQTGPVRSLGFLADNRTVITASEDKNVRLADVGVLAVLIAPLAEAGISVFPVSTFDTDYLLVKANDLGKTMAVLRTSSQPSR